jgi:hypothetical protein
MTLQDETVLPILDGKFWQPVHVGAYKYFGLLLDMWQLHYYYYY